MSNYYRIRTNIAQDQVVKAKLTQDIDFLEILSLKIRQEDTYKLHVSNYGVIVGRVLANDAFGIPNAKVSVFVPLDDEDKLRSEISNIYPYINIQTKDNDNRRYNLLPDESNDTCYRVVGTFPNKRLVLDNNTEIEVFEKYWKYTTVTNKSGDYMIFGVPTGSHQVHVDVDLSDIGVLSQKPRDFMYKGYSITQFDNPNQFKESTNLDNLSQLLSQTSSVYVYPFWGDSDVEQIAITRCDLQVQYKFEPTCVFFGSIVSDNFSNNIGDKCNPSKFVGFNRNLVAGEGTIEMIRKTQDGLIEEFQIQGNRLIDGDGVWCYQIPMNLDYVGTDEFGNIVPTDNPNKGIPTRTSVRFRISMQETNNEGISRHRAKYLVPNVHQLVKETQKVEIREPNKYVQCYEFGSATPDEFFRDLYWNKVYSIKNYIPRIQLGTSRNTQKYSAIRTVNSSGNLNPFPFNRARFRLFFAYRVLCILMDVIITIICGLNWFVSKIAGIKILGVRPFSWICNIMPCISLTGGLTEDEDSNVEYFPCCKYDKCMKCEQAGCRKESDKGTLMDTVQQSLAQEYDTVNLDFYNDWINGCLYLPLWFWKKTKKKKFLFGLFSKKAVNRYCNCDSNYRKLRITENCSLHIDHNYLATDSDSGTNFHYQFPDNSPIIGHGIIKEVENKDGLKIYYYTPGVPTTDDYRDTKSETVSYVRLYSTDIILLGSLNECDLDNLPRPFINLPSSTANIPYISTIKDDATDSDIDQSGTSQENGTVEVTGMDWLGKINDGLFMDLTCVKVRTKPKTCINLARISELGVTLDARYYDAISSNNVLKYDNERPADGLITRYELVDNETRAMFASLNHNGLQEKVKNNNTGYDTYKLIYIYPTDFDGHMNKYSSSYTNSLKVKTYDNQDPSYINYIFGTNSMSEPRHFYSDNSGQLPVFNNSFYFYFGLNEGNTAIDKFNNLFYSECFKNYKYPFSLTYTTTPAKWCKSNDNISNKLLLSNVSTAEGLDSDYATIDITLKGINVPYSYKLYGEFNTELLSESDLYASTIKFGYNIENGVYTSEKHGAMKLVSNGEYYTYEENGKKYVYLLDNGNYKIEVTDFNGNMISQSINIIQSPIKPNLTVNGLGNKYYDGVTFKKDICNESADYGEIIFDSISIDGKLFSIKNAIELTENGNDGYKLTCEYVDESDIRVEYAFLQIEPFFSNTESIDLEFDECICDGSYRPIVEDGKFKFKIWIPGDYKITLTQYCNCDNNGTCFLNDNTSSETVNVPNGKPFLTYLADTPVRFIIGKNTDINSGDYNKNFYSRVADTTFPTDEKPNSIYGWFNAHKENVYRFEKVSNENEMNVWSDYINVDYISGDNGTNTDISLSTKLAVIEYKYKSMMNMSNIAYIHNDEEKTISYTSSGGKSPILYRGCYPEYSLFDDSITESSKLSSSIFDSDANVTCLSRTPNIISSNYSQYNQDIDGWFKVGGSSPKFNTLFNDNQYIGNYFAAFTSNAGFEFNNNNWVVNSDIIYQSNPQSSNPNYNVEPGGMANGSLTQDFSVILNNNSYLRAMTIDRRLDYSYFMILPYNDNNSNNIIGDDSWKRGRLVGYQYNGIEMCYDKSYNIIGKDTIIKGDNGISYNESGNTYEYYFPTIYTSVEDVPSCFTDGEELKIRNVDDITNKKLYSCIFKSSRTYDINNRFWAYGRDIDCSDLNELKFNDYTGDYHDVNGSFSVRNYPTIRKLDFYNFPYSSRYSYSAVSCSYNDSLELIDNGGSEYNFSSTIEEGGSLSFDINGSNTITLNGSSLDDCAASSTGNAIFKCSSGGGTATFKINGVVVSFKIPDETVNTTHRNFTYLPFYTTFDYQNNPFNELNTMPLDNTLDSLVGNVINKLCDNNGKCFGGQLDMTNVSSSSDFSSQIAVTNQTLPNDVYNLTRNRFVFSDSNNTIAYSDESLVKNASYSITLIDNPLFNKKIFDLMSIFYFRRYINNNNDNLSKDILTLNIGTFVDLRKFTMSCICEIDTAMSGSDDVEVEIPTVDTDEDGNTTTGTTTDSETVQIEIQRQVTTFLIKIPDDGDNDYNNDFTNFEKISASIKYDGKIASDATVSEYIDEDDVRYVSIKLIWGGALSGVLLPLVPSPIELFIKMPSGLIFKLDFKLGNNGLIMGE